MATVIVVFAIALKLFKNKVLAGLTALFFLLASGSVESINWISATGHIANSLLIFFLCIVIFYGTKKEIF